jgi:hypothetical protein
LIHYLVIVLILIAISIIDVKAIIQKQLKKELYLFSSFAIFIIIYGYLYFTNSYYASISSLFNEIVVHK